MRPILAVVALASLALGACAPNTYAPIADLGPPPTITPGSSTIVTPWTWPPQGPPTGELAALLERLKTPQAIADHLTASYPWQDDYDTTRFLTPAELVAQRRGVCTAFARFWVRALQAQGIRAEFVSFWGPSSAHAIAIFRDPASGHWRLASNQALYKNDLGLERDGALAAAAGEFYGAGWGDLLVFDADSGAVRQRMRNANATTAPLAAPSVIPGRNLFTVRR